MARSYVIALLCLAVLGSTVSAASGRSLQQALPPGSSFGGPFVAPASSVMAPAGTVAKINWRGVGTQNYSSGSNSQYQAAGAVANMFLQTDKGVVGGHFFLTNSSGGISPVFTRVNITNGQEIGRVMGNVVAQDPTPNTNDNGGYGSVPSVLLQVTSATGFFEGVTWITRGNVSGGVVPGNPKLFTLPASPQGVANFLLAVPYQADYKFWVPSTGSPTTGR